MPGQADGTPPGPSGGEIALEGATLMQGYVGVPLDEILDGEGFFRTGDGGYIDAQGRMVWEGRINDIIKTGGATVSPIEVDAVIESVPGVRISRTVGVPHATLGELVVTCIVPHEAAPLDEDQIRDFAKARLASYKAPRAVLFVDEGALRLAGSGKVKTRELAELAAKGACDGRRFGRVGRAR